MDWRKPVVDHKNSQNHARWAMKRELTIHPMGSLWCLGWPMTSGSIDHLEKWIPPQNRVLRLSFRFHLQAAWSVMLIEITYCPTNILCVYMCIYIYICVCVCMILKDWSTMKQMRVWVYVCNSSRLPTDKWHHQKQVFYVLRTRCVHRCIPLLGGYCEEFSCIELKLVKKGNSLD